MFNNGNIEIKKRMMEDRLLSELYAHDNCKVFYEHSTLLSALFTARASTQLENFLELSKEEFITILMESAILLSTDKNKDDGDNHQGGHEIKRKFDGEAIMAAISNVGSFDMNALTYVDFLDCLVRVAFIYPFPDAERHHYNAMDQKL